MEFVRERGRGGFARVDEVRLADGRLVARKTLDPKQEILDEIHIDELKTRFSREVRYQSSISHPNVAQILGADLDSNPPFCLLPLATCNLKDELVADRTLGGMPQKALYDILSGLEVLEEKGYVHRDLKPQNVLRFDSADGSYTYAISDFGLITAGAANSTTLTASGVQGGTAHYSAPELIHNFRRATSKADMYAFGAILHDIFDGRARVPYSELTGPGPIGEVITRCTKANPARRYRSIAELRDALYAALNAGNVVFQSSSEASAANALSQGGLLADADWDQVCQVIEENEARNVSNRNIFRVLTAEHLDQLHDSAPEVLKAVGISFAMHSIREYFDFDYCDVLAGKLEKLFELGDVELKAFALLGMLCVGVEHNRWFVEWKFFKLAGQECDQNVIQRLITEASVQRIELRSKIAHLERSISVSRAGLHNVLQQAVTT